MLHPAPLQTNSVGTTAATTGKAVTLTMAAAPASIGGLSFATYASHLTAAATATEAPTSHLDPGKRTNGLRHECT